MSTQTILVADDEVNIRELAQLYLRKEGYQVMTANNGREALQKIREFQPDMLVLDLMMPELDGWEVCRRVRAESSLPILMLTARDDDIDKIVGLEMGADDYLTKPFNPRELVARVRAVLRRSGEDSLGSRDLLNNLGNVQIDPAGRELLISGRRVQLRAREFDLLYTLAKHRNMVLSRDQLLDLVWDYESDGKTRTVDVHIANLRDKLADSDVQIETVWGVGYKLVLVK